MTPAVTDPQQAAKARRRNIIVTVIVASVALHVLAALLAGL